MNKFILLFFIFTKISYAQSENFLYDQVKKNCRREIINNSIYDNIADKSLILKNDRAEDLVEDSSKMIYSLNEMENLNLKSKKLSVAPWSDSYWPLYEGTLGHRYNDTREYFANWHDSHNYVLAHPAISLVNNNEFDYLSPSEKYDLLLELNSENLTKSNWAEGERYFKENGTVETWMGLCHGWSAASMMMPNPQTKVEVKLREKKMVFYPSDIKGLATLLWAKGQFRTRFIGGRCNTKGPKVDEMGRPLQQECLDNNPGTWHLAIVNQIGLFDRAFVMDATYDYQVWNQPVYGYEYSYYNPATKTDMAKLSEATVKLSEWQNDERKSVRSPDAKSVVGIKMKVIYVGENSPSIQEYQETIFSRTEYMYDLELDSHNQIIGGEWYSDNHPDFLWVADKKSFPATFGDQPGLSVNLNNISKTIKKDAQRNAKNELPSGVIVRELFRQSSH